METGDPRIRDGVSVNTKLLLWLETGVISEDECYADILDMTFGAGEHTWRDCILVIPVSLRSRFLDYVRFYLIPLNYMPMLGVVIPSPKSPEEIQAIKEERRPRYIKLFQLIEEVCAPDESTGGHNDAWGTRFSTDD